MVNWIGLTYKRGGGDVFVAEDDWSIRIRDREELKIHRDINNLVINLRDIQDI